MGKVSEITITKGKTVRAGDREEWVRLEFSIKALVDDQNDMEAAKAHLEGLLDGWLSVLETPASGGAKQEPAKPVEALKPADLFPEDLKGLLSFEDQGEWIIIKPKRFLGAENFAKVADIVKKCNGEYVSSGKQSHFRIPKHAKTT
jgi:hypothetical protein